LSQFRYMGNGTLSHDTSGRGFARLDPKFFRESFLSWVQAVFEVTEGQVIAIDGKTLLRSHDKGSGWEAIGMVSAWATANHLVLGQVNVETRSNEITAIPALLAILDLTGCIIAIDAEHAYEGLIRSLKCFGGVPREVLVDNQKATVLRPAKGSAPRFNDRLLDLSGHSGLRREPAAPIVPRPKARASGWWATSSSTSSFATVPSGVGNTSISWPSSGCKPWLTGACMARSGQWWPTALPASSHI
jgi:predicted transposase YbfD/YdcC